jgi:hypothetical protein
MGTYAVKGMNRPDRLLHYMGFELSYGCSTGLSHLIQEFRLDHVTPVRYRD